MNPKAMNNAFRTNQSGAALVVALILLVALSLMAISSMNTASLDLIMAGNEQYRSRSFNAAEAGIERALVGGTFDSSTDFTQAAVSTGSGTDTYAYTISRPSNGAVEPPPSGYSAAEGTFGTIYFRITSDGASERGTRSRTVQELFQVVKSSDGLGNDSDCGNSSLDGTISTC